MAQKSNLTVEETARWLGVAPRTVYRLVQRGQLPGFKVGGQWRFSIRVLEQWAEQTSVSRLHERMPKRPLSSVKRGSGTKENQKER